MENMHVSILCIDVNAVIKYLLGHVVIKRRNWISLLTPQSLVRMENMQANCGFSLLPLDTVPFNFGQGAQ